MHQKTQGTAEFGQHQYISYFKLLVETYYIHSLELLVLRCM